MNNIEQQLVIINADCRIRARAMESAQDRFGVDSIEAKQAEAEYDRVAQKREDLERQLGR